VPHTVERIIIAAGLAVLVGCASNPSVSSLSSEQRQKAAELLVLPSGSLPRDSYQIVGSVEGLACKRNLYASGKPSVEEAQQGVRIRAALLGADAVTNVLCENKQQVDWGKNCWQTVVCIGDAITVTDKSLLRRPDAQPAQ
jgi:uncharacterized protein YbjQ (UPF0145 family)